RDAIRQTADFGWCRYPRAAHEARIGVGAEAGGILLLRPQVPQCPKRGCAMDEPSPAEVLARAEEFGIDLTLLYENLKRTPTERLERHQAALAFLETMREAGRNYRRAAG